jgi:hypothetical protein
MHFGMCGPSFINVMDAMEHVAEVLREEMSHE